MRIQPSQNSQRANTCQYRLSTFCSLLLVQVQFNLKMASVIGEHLGDWMLESRSLRGQLMTVPAWHAKMVTGGIAS